MISRLTRITERAKSNAEEQFNNLYSALDVTLLRHAFYKLDPSKAPGIDGQTVKQYEENLESRSKTSQATLISYQPKPSRRVEIAKGNGKTRPLGIACIEDKIVQRALVMILERIYEEDFLPISFGFRPGKSCHDALCLLGEQIATKKVNWISDADIKGFFNNVDHQDLMELLRKRISDPRMLKLIWRFLKAGVMIDDRVEETNEGVPQGMYSHPC